MFSGSDLDYYEKYIGPSLPHPEQLEIPPVTGRLGQTIEQGTKRGVFAIANYINQRLLKPIMDWLQKVLRPLPMDGTFNQQRPLDRLIGSTCCHCFDLKSATDRWPLSLMFEVMCHMFDRRFAPGVVNSALGANIFDVPFVKKKRSSVSFVTGQPLGYYSSWPLFALTHHFVVWWCAQQVHPGRRFDKYAVLGDDVIICDDLVAEKYKEVLDFLEAKISVHKSLISHSGTGEFAKRFCVRGLAVDLSPASAQALTNFYHPYGLMAINDRYPVRRVWFQPCAG